MNPFVPPIKSVSISEYSALDASSTPPTIYFKIILSSSMSTWHVWHRYSEFYEFHQALKALSVVIPVPLPSRSFIVAPNLERRREGLELYLKNLIQFHANLKGFWSLECVHSFFSIPSSSPFYKKPSLQKHDKETLTLAISPPTPAKVCSRSALIAAPSATTRRPAGGESRGPEEELAANAALLSAQEGLLDSLSESIRRQKNMGLLMGSEIESQNQLLDDLHVDVDRTKSKVSQNSRRVQKIL